MFEISTIKSWHISHTATFGAGSKINLKLCSFFQTVYTKHFPFMSEGWIITKTDLNVILSYEGYIKTLLEMFYHVFIYFQITLMYRLLLLNLVPNFQSLV